MVLWCAMFLVRGCALVGSLAIQTYSLSRLSFAIKIISVNGSESVGPVVQNAVAPGKTCLTGMRVRVL